ncbi:hypothetical protein H9P43_006917 [Blastocladiella emersonii ATCC 22665]|nr:hypothetical protein H9P43_006917 [Blastocladiella emersonii ATCC 22665]
MLAINQPQRDEWNRVLAWFLQAVSPDGLANLRFKKPQDPKPASKGPIPRCCLADLWHALDAHPLTLFLPLLRRNPIIKQYPACAAAGHVSANIFAHSSGTTSGSTTSGSVTTPSGPAASAVVQELDINLQEWDDVGSESDMTVVPASSSAVTKNKNITKIVVDSEADEEVDADEEESECELGPSSSSSRARKMATKAKGRDKNKTVKTPPASPTKRTHTSAVKGKSGAAVPAAQDDDEADDDDSATPPASPTKRARRGPAKGKGKDRSA